MKTITQTKKIYNTIETDNVDLWLMEQINDGWRVLIANPSMITTCKQVADADYQAYYDNKAAAYEQYIHTTID